MTQAQETPTFTVEPHGRRWAIKSDGETLLIAARKTDAVKLAKAADKTLHLEQRPHETRHAEPRSFAPQS